MIGLVYFTSLTTMNAFRIRAKNRSPQATLILKPHLSILCTCAACRDVNIYVLKVWLHIKPSSELLLWFPVVTTSSIIKKNTSVLFYFHWTMSATDNTLWFPGVCLWLFLISCSGKPYWGQSYCLNAVKLSVWAYLYANFASVHAC